MNAYEFDETIKKCGTCKEYDCGLHVCTHCGIEACGYEDLSSWEIIGKGVLCADLFCPDCVQEFKNEKD